MSHPVMLGCDPGSSGGLALVYSDGSAEVHRMPETEKDMVDLTHELARRDWPGLPRATVEYVRSSPQMGVVSAFTFGRGYGSLRTALIAAGFSVVEVTPPKWQRELGVSARGVKGLLKARAQALYPVIHGGSKVTLWNADALLIATWGARTGGSR